MPRQNESLAVPSKVVKYWASAVGSTTTLATGDEVCCRRLNVGVIGAAGTLAVEVLNPDGTQSRVTYDAAHILNANGILTGQFTKLSAVGSTGCYNIIAEW